MVYIPLLFGSEEFLIALLLRFLLQMQFTSQKLRKLHHISHFVIVIFDHAEFFDNELFNSIARIGRIISITFEVVFTVIIWCARTTVIVTCTHWYMDCEKFRWKCRKNGRKKKTTNDRNHTTTSTLSWCPLTPNQEWKLSLWCNESLLAMIFFVFFLKIFFFAAVNIQSRAEVTSNNPITSDSGPKLHFHYFAPHIGQKKGRYATLTVTLHICKVGFVKVHFHFT